MLKPLVAATILSGLSVAAQAVPITYTVDPNAPVSATNFHTISAATMNADSDNNLSDSYVIKVTPTATGYINDFSTITRPMTIETATPGTQVVLTDSNGSLAGPDKGIIVNFSSLTVDGLQFVGAVSSSGNGAGIRDQGPQPGTVGGTSLTVRNSTFINNQDGILTGSDTGSSFAETVQISNDNFVGNGGPIGPAHALYIGDAATADIINSTFCGTVDGHDIKSRALSTTVTGSTMYIAATGTAGAGCSSVGSASAGIDLPNGGVGDIYNDTIIQGTQNQNGALVIYGGESPLNPAASLDVSGTSFQGDGAPDSVGVNEIGGCLAPVAGTGPGTFQNVATQVNPSGCLAPAVPVPTVPEPQSLWLLLTALGCCAAFYARAAPLQGRNLPT